MVQLHWKTVWQLLTRLNIALPYDPTIELFGILTQMIKKCMAMQTWPYL